MMDCTFVEIASKMEIRNVARERTCLYMNYRKKWYMLTASILATSILLAPTVNASSYTVQKGDTLTKIAKAHNTTTSQLKKWNNLKGDSIYVLQKLVVGESTVSSVQNKKTAVTSQTITKVVEKKQTDEMVTYHVLKGDTLTKIAKKFQVTVADIKKWNAMKSDSIFIGQSLKIKTTIQAVETEAVTSPKTPLVENSWAGDASGELTPEEIGKKQLAEAEARIALQLAKETSVKVMPDSKGQAIYTKAIEVAKTLIGTPYVFAGSTPQGFDCSGFVQYVYTTAGSTVNRLDSESYFMKGSTVVVNPVPGDVVFFKNTYKAGISHMGIYLGDGQFIHAGNDGVEISKLSYTYWKSHFVAYKRLHQFVGK